MKNFGLSKIFSILKKVFYDSVISFCFYESTALLVLINFEVAYLKFILVFLIKPCFKKQKVEDYLLF